MELELNKIYQGDALSVLKEFPSDSIDCVVTSPPYYNLRSYLFEGAVTWKQNISKEEKEYVKKELEKNKITEK